MIVNETSAKSIITKSNLPEADYVINPYLGCSHSCIYCYARFMKRFSGHSEQWGRFVDVKVNACELIPAVHKRFQRKNIFISSVTDPYQPVEKKYQLSRGILKKLADYESLISIQTKSDLVTRDIDLLSRLKNCEIGITITSDNDQIRKEVEPGTSSIINRIEALKKLHTAGIKTYVFIGPILPYITDWKKIISLTRDYADYYYFENLNTYGSIMKDIKEWINNKHRDLIKLYRDIYYNASVDDFWRQMEQEIRDYCNNEKVAYKMSFFHGR